MGATLADEVDGAAPVGPRGVEADAHEIVAVRVVVDAVQDAAGGNTNSG